MKRKILIVLLAALIMALVFSCTAEEETNTPYTADGESVEIDEQEPNSVIVYTDDLGDFDFEGYEFSMLTRLNPRFTSPINVEEEIGEPFNDAMYRRNRNLEARFNFKFKEVLDEGLDTATSRARTSILAGSNEYDMITLTTAGSLPLVQEGLMHPVSALPHINLDKPYWNQQLNSDFTIAGKKYFAHGAHDISTYDITHMLLFNKQMIQDYSMENPYELVKAGKWTFDKFAEMSRAATRDLNGDGVMDENDSYGLLMPSPFAITNFYIAAGLKGIEKDNNDIPYSAMSDNKFIDVFDKIFEITWDINNPFFGVQYWDLEPIFVRMFENDQGLFLNSSFYHINKLRGMETDFGILPYPKYTETQEEYYSHIENTTAALAPITADANSLERVSVILEALACESLNTVIPAYYDISLKVKNTRDEESAEMLDIIFANRVIDFGSVIWFNDIRNGTFMPMFQNNKRNLASRLESIERVVQRLIDNIVEAFEKLD